MKIFCRIFIIFFFGGFFGVTTNAQSVDTPASGLVEMQPDWVQCKLSIYTWRERRFISSLDDKLDAPLPELFFFSGTEPVSVQPAYSKRTQRLDYIGPKELILYRGSGRSESVEPDYTPYTRVDLAEGFETFLVMLMPHLSAASKDDGAAVQAFAIPVTASVFQEDRPVFFNLTEHELAIQFGKEQRLLPPRGSVALDAEGTNSRILLRLAVQIDGDWRPVKTTSISTHRGAAMMVLLDSKDIKSGWDIRGVSLDGL